MPRPPNPLGFLELVGLGLRNARRSPVVTTVLVAVVFLAGFGFAAAPRYINDGSNRALAADAAEASSVQRNITFSRLGRIEPQAPEDPFGRVVTQGSRLREGLEGELADVIEGSIFGVVSPQFVVQHVPARSERSVNRYFRFRFQESSSNSTELVEGALPTPADPITIPSPECDPDAAQIEGETCPEITLSRYQTAVTRETADWLAVEMGDWVLISPVVETPQNRGLPLASLDYRFALEISGIVELGDENADVWLGDPGLHRPRVIRGDIEGFDVFATGLMAAEDYQRLLAGTAPSRMTYSWRLFVDYDQVDSSNIEEVGEQVNKLRLEHQIAGDVERVQLYTGIDDLAFDYRKTRDLAIAYASLILAGLLGLAVSVMVVLAALAARRQQPTTTLIRSRGASSPRLAAARFAEGILLFVPASLLGLLAAHLLVEGNPAPSPVGSAVVVGVVFSTVFGLLALPSIASDLGRLLTGRPAKVNRLRRVVVEAFVLILAAAGMFLLRRRGAGAATGSAVDPLLASVPLLAALAAGVFLLRLAPHAARLASVIGSRARGVVGLVGFKSLARRSLPAQLPAVVMLLAVTIAVFGSILLHTVDSIQVEGSWHTVGANFRIEPQVDGSTISPELALDDVPGIESSADAVLITAQFSNKEAYVGNIQLLGADLTDYQRVGNGTLADPALPPSMLREITPVDVGTQSNPIPALASRRWPVGTPRVGQVVTVVIDFRPVVAVIDEVRDEFPGLDVRLPFLVLSREALGLVNERIDVDPNRRYVRAPDSSARSLSESVDSQLRSVKLMSRPDLLEAIKAAPTVTTVQRLSQVSLAVAVLLAVTAVLAGFALTSRERTRDIGYLRAIGLSRRQMTWVTFTEQLPPALAATILGALTGTTVAFVTGPSLDLTPLTGTEIDRGPLVAWGPIALAAAILLGTVVLAVAIYSYSNRELDLATVLRRDDRT